MIRTPPSLSVLLVLTAGLLPGCAVGERDVAADGSGLGEVSPAAIRVVDAAGAELTLAGPARRVVSLVPSATETLHAMRAQNVLVGRTDFDTARWAAHLPSVGGGIQPNLEALVALRPDLVIRFAGEQDPRTPGRLDALGIPHLAVRPDRVEDIYDTAQLLGSATGHVREADSLVAEIREGLASIVERVRRLPRIRVAYVLAGSPPWVVGPGTYIDQVVSMAGGDNVFSDLGALYSAVSPEELRAREVEVVLISSDGQYDRTLTPDARLERVPSALELPGPGVVQAAERLTELLHGRSLR
ncbi:MAG TPA: helical backbone metal receptor [Longimicrobiales bacterium]|nr:helical backbone metal receptor [Longimicrobiales bacterium]